MAKPNPNKSTPPSKPVDWDRVRQQMRQPSTQPQQHEKDLARLDRMASKINK